MEKCVKPSRGRVLVGCKLQEPGKHPLVFVGKMCKTGHWTGACGFVRAYTISWDASFLFVFLGECGQWQKGFLSACSFSFSSAPTPTPSSQIDRKARSLLIEMARACLPSGICGRHKDHQPQIRAMPSNRQGSTRGLTHGEGSSEGEAGPLAHTGNGGEAQMRS